MPALSISKQAGNVARQVTRRPKGLALRRDARRRTAAHAFSALSELKKNVFFVFGRVKMSKENIWRFLKHKGFSDIATAAIMGNMEAESGCV